MLRVWAKKHRIALVVAGVWVLLTIFDTLPPQPSWFVLQRLIVAIGVAAQGVFVIVPMWILGSTDSLGPYISLLIISGVIVSVAVEFLWREAWPGKAAVILFVVINTCVGLFIVLAQDIIVGSPYAECEKWISETSAIRIVAYPEGGMLPGGQFLFLATRDSGRNWKRIMDFRHDDAVDPPCENIQSLGTDHYWMWMGGKWAGTNDGGKTWQAVTLPGGTSHFGLIQNVEFRDSMNACMSLDRRSGTKICTQDAGRTWHIPDP